MVRRSVLLNPDFEEVQKEHPTDTLDLQVLWAAWERTEQLKRQFEATGSPVKPLMLIQYPDGAEARLRAEVVEKFLRDRGLLSNSTYATWLTEEHSPNLDLIAQNSSSYRALIFKQAIATGWDCPRAQVLVQFRKPGSDTFQIQTLGRLMRTPEQKHYDNEDLNVAYVYSDLAGVTVKITSDEPGFALRDTTITRGPLYPSVGLKLRSVFQPRRREFHYPTTSTLEPALFSELNVKVKPLLVKPPIRETRRDVLVDGSLDAKAVVGGSEAAFDGAFVDGVLGEQFVQALYDQVITSRIGPYRSREQSRSRIKTSLVKWFQSEIQWQPDEIQHFVLEQSGTVSEAIDAACHIASASDEAKAIIDARLRRRTTDDWEVPRSELIASDNWEKPEAIGTLFIPPLVPIGRSKPELRFEHWLGIEVNANRVVWWWKNGVRDEKYLGIPYKLIAPVTGVASEEITYPDYIVMSASEEVWIIEVKDIDDPDGEAGGATSCKARGLAVWAEEMSALHQTNTELLSLTPVRAVVVVPGAGGENDISVKVGSPSDWQEPTPANHSTGHGWTPINFAD
jgi:type III restriction enzyme